MDELNKKYNIDFQLVDVLEYGKFIVNPMDNVISKVISEGQPWEAYMHKYFKEHIRSNSVVVDIGANIGAHSVTISNLFNSVTVHAFEPVSINSDILVKNVEINELNVVCHKYGLGDKNDTMYEPNFEESQEANYGGHGLTWDKNGKSVVVRTLDSFEFDGVSFIKIDVEGFEINVLKGAMQTIQKSKPVMIIEIWDRMYEYSMSQDVFKELGEMGYEHKQISSICGISDYLFTCK